MLMWLNQSEVIINAMSQLLNIYIDNNIQID